MELAIHHFLVQLLANMIMEQLYWEIMLFIHKLLYELF